MVDWFFDICGQSILLFLCMLPILLVWQSCTAKNQKPIYILGLLVFTFYISSLMTATGLHYFLFATPHFAPYFNFELFVDIFSCPIQYVLNILLFVPLGFLPPLLFPKYRNEKSVLLLGFCLSFMIELLQMFCMRTTDLDDLLTNIIGTLLGYWIFLVAKQQTIFHMLRHRTKYNHSTAATSLLYTLVYSVP